MNSSKSSQKRVSKISFKVVPPFDLFYQLTYMSAIAASGLTRNKLFELSALTSVTPSTYFVAVNTLVAEFRFDYPEACRRVGMKAKSENMKTFLLRLSDALRSGEPLSDYLARESEAQSKEYENEYERNLESLKQWSNAFSSIVMSVALIIIIQVITSMIYSTDLSVMIGLVFTGITLSGFSAWIIWRSAPQEVMNVSAKIGSKEQKRAMRLFRLLGPVMLMIATVCYLVKLEEGYILIMLAGLMLPIGIASMISDKRLTKKDIEFSTFLRSLGGMTSSSGLTLKEALLRLDLSSFPYLRADIERLAKRLQARVSPEICWQKFGQESGSRLISDVIDIFYGGVQVGGDPEHVGYLCSIFAAKTAQLRAKRRLVTGTFSGLTTVMQAVVAGLMVFVLSIVINFAALVEDMMPGTEDAMAGQQQMSLGMAEFSQADLQFLSMITIVMIVALAIVGAAAIILSDGGYKLKVTFYLAITTFISGISFIVVPPMVAGILTV